jgi:hypothetical protein
MAPWPSSISKSLVEGARTAKVVLLVQEQRTAARALPPSPNPSLWLEHAGSDRRAIQLEGTEGEINRGTRRLDIFEQLLRGKFKIELGQTKCGMLQQPGIGIFVEALQFGIDQPDVRNAPAAIIFQAVRQSAIAIIRGNDFDDDKGRAGCVTSWTCACIGVGRARSTTSPST